MAFFVNLEYKDNKKVGVPRVPKIERIYIL